MPRLYSYIVLHDIGFAPNPFHATCTLATCKPDVRGGASVGDWVVGTGSSQHQRQGRLVYAMQVDERLTFDAYWSDGRFASKRPDLRGSRKYRYGDNLYHHDASGEWVQANGRHSHEDGTANLGHVRRDTSSDAVLVATNFFTYWGGSGPTIPEQFRDWDGVDLCVDRQGCKYKPFAEPMKVAVIDWLLGLPSGVQADPLDWST